MSAPTDAPTAAGAGVAVVRAQLRFGWWSLLVFLSLGLVLEALHGLKIQYYLDLANATRRMMWTLAHTHGTLLSVVLIVFALTARAVELPRATVVLVGRCLRAAIVLMPSGFLLGGAFLYGGDPGLGVALVVPAGLLLFVGVAAAARRIGR